MTETECNDCDWSENCEWALIVNNNWPCSPLCTAKAWHEKSLKTFKEMTRVVRAKIVGGGEEVQRATWGDYCHVPAQTVGEFAENSKQDKDLI